MNMVCTTDIDMQDTCEPEMIDKILSNVGWAIRSTYHTMLGSSPGSAVFGRDMLFDIPYIADWALPPSDCYWQYKFHTEPPQDQLPDSL